MIEINKENNYKFPCNNCGKVANRIIDIGVDTIGPDGIKNVTGALKIGFCMDCLIKFSYMVNKEIYTND